MIQFIISFFLAELKTYLLIYSFLMLFLTLNINKY